MSTEQVAILLSIAIVLQVALFIFGMWLVRHVLRAGTTRDERQDDRSERQDDRDVRADERDVRADARDERSDRKGA
jgi:flagellar biosynthesis/type III secretory pathway M-ring protein FliF/YscJ